MPDPAAASLDARPAAIPFSLAHVNGLGVKRGDDDMLLAQAVSQAHAGAQAPPDTAFSTYTGRRRRDGDAKTDTERSNT